METFDINSITHDKLRLLLDTARCEIKEYARYHEEAKKISKRRKENDSCFGSGCLIIGIVFSFFIGSVFIFGILSDYKFYAIFATILKKLQCQ